MVRRSRRNSEGANQSGGVGVGAVLYGVGLNGWQATDYHPCTYHQYVSLSIISQQPSMLCSMLFRCVAHQGQ